RGIATEQTSEHIENTLAWKAPAYKKFLEQEIEKLVDSTEQEDGTFVFSLKTLELADYYFTQLKQTQVSDS
ncbi:14129_t:CDS:1, partial [Cetraspora pellucida]